MRTGVAFTTVVRIMVLQGLLAVSLVALNGMVAFVAKPRQTIIRLILWAAVTGILAGCVVAISLLAYGGAAAEVWRKDWPRILAGIPAIAAVATWINYARRMETHPEEMWIGKDRLRRFEEAVVLTWRAYFGDDCPVGGNFLLVDPRAVKRVSLIPEPSEARNEADRTTR